MGAKHVTAIEANSHLAEIARNNIRKNGMADRIVVLNALSSDVTAADLPHGKADVLVRVCFVCLGFCVAHFDSTRWRQTSRCWCVCVAWCRCWS